MQHLRDHGLLHVPALYPHFPDLTTLNLSNNSIAFLPTQISSLKGMRFLHLDNNFLSFIPDLSRLPELQEFRLPGSYTHPRAHATP